MESYEHRKNRFDGYKILIGSTEFDIWRIEKTFNTIFSNAEIQARLKEAERLKGTKK